MSRTRYARLATIAAIGAVLTQPLFAAGIYTPSWPAEPSAITGGYLRGQSTLEQQHAAIGAAVMPTDVANGVDETNPSQPGNTPDSEERHAATHASDAAYATGATGFVTPQRDVGNTENGPFAVPTPLNVDDNNPAGSWSAR